VSGRRDAARRTAGMGMLFALALVLQYVESLIPSLFTFAPGIKLGLSNIVTMFCLFCAGLPEALTIAVLKGVFAFIIRGPAAGILSTVGGIGSVAVMKLLIKFRQSRGLTSVFGAVSHNMFQLAAECVMMKSRAALYYAPVLVVSGIVMGTVTAYITRTVMPYLEKISGRRDSGL